jgi:hypothetical protein
MIEQNGFQNGFEVLDVKLSNLMQIDASDLSRKIIQNLEDYQELR